MDLQSLNTKDLSEKGIDLKIYHPTTNEPLDIIIHIYGVDSEQYKKAIKIKQKSMLEKIAVEKRGNSHSIKTTDDFDAEDFSGKDMVFACMSGWSNVEFQGEKLEFNEKNVFMIFEKCPWLFEQVDKAIHDRENFLSAWSPDSGNGSEKS